MSLIAFNAGSIEATLTLDRSPFQRGLDEAKAEARRFSDESLSIKLDADAAPAKEKIDEVRVSAERLATTAATIRLDADSRPALNSVAQVSASVRALGTGANSVKIDADIATLLVKIDQAKAKIDDLGRAKTNPKIDVDIESAQRRIMLIQGELDNLAANPKGRSQIEIDVETARAEAKMAEAQRHLEDLQRVRPKIDLDISAAEAKLATLQAELATVGDSAGDAAAQTESQLSGLAAGVAAAFPPASTAVLALSGALSLAVVPMAAIQIGMTGIQAAAAPLAGEFLDMQSQVSATFDQGLKPAITDTSALMPTLNSGLVGTATALSGVATQVGGLVSSQQGLVDMQATFSNVDSTISAMAPGIAGFVGNVEDLAALGSGELGGLSGIVNGLSVEWHDLITSLSASGQAQGAISSLVSVLGAVAADIPPVVSAGVQLMDVLGPPLAGALHVTGDVLNFLTGPLGGVTSSALAGYAAWKLLSAAADSSIFTKLVTGAQSAATTVAGWTSTVEAGTGAAQASAMALAEQAVALDASAVAAEANAVALATVATDAEGTALAAETAAVALAGEAEAAGNAALLAESAATTIATLTGAQSDAAVSAGANATALEAEALAAESAAVAAEADATALAALAGAASRASAAAAGTAGALRAQAGAAATASTESGLASASTVGFAGAVGKLGSALPIVGVAVIAAYTAIKSFTTSTDDAVAAMGQGGQAAADMAAKVAGQTETNNQAIKATSVLGSTIDDWISSNILGIATTQSATDAFNAARAAMTPLQRAQQDATIAQGDYNKAVADFGPNSQQATDAQKKYAVATLAVTQAQAAATVSAANIDASMQAAAGHFGAAAQAADGAAQSTVSYANALASLGKPMASASDKMSAFAADTQGASDSALTMLDASNALSKSFSSFADSTLKITPAMIDASGAINTVTKDGQELATGISGTAKAFENLRGATIASAQASGDTLPSSLVKGDVALEGARQKLIQLAEQHGATKEQAQGLVDTYLAFPPSVKTEVSAPGGVEATATALGLQDAVVRIPNDHTVVLKALSADARAQLEDLGLKVQTLPNGQVVVTVDDSAAIVTLDSFKQLANGTAVVLKMGADPSGARDTYIATVALGNGQTATMRYTANAVDADGTVHTTVALGNGQTAVMTYNANRQNADGTINATVDYGNGRVATVHVNADASSAYGTINGIPRDIYITAHVTASSNVNSAGGLASGGILTPMAEGGIIANAGGNQLTPLASGIATVVSPNTWRIIGDNMTVPESYIPQDGSTRSQAILSQTADAMGWGLVPKGLAEVLAGYDGGSDGYALPTGGSGVSLGSGGGGHDGSAAAIREVAARLESLQRSLLASRQVTNNVTVEAAVGQAADEVQRVMRRLSDMGAFER